MGVSADVSACLEELYDKNASMVYRIALYYSGNEYAAEEIVQDVFIRLHKSLGNVELKAIRSWLYTTAKHMAMNRKRDGRYEIPEEDIDGELEEILYTESAEEELLRLMQDKERHELVREILDELHRKDERWYTAVSLTYLLGNPQKEAAEMMGVSLEVLQSVLYRTRKWIQKKYKEKYDRLKSL